MKTALYLCTLSCLKAFLSSSESSNFDAQPTLPYQRLMMHIYSAISNGNNPTFSSLSALVTPSCTTVFMHLSELCSATNASSIYSKSHQLAAIVNLQQC